MKKLFFIAVLGLMTLLPITVFANEQTDYLLYASQQEIEIIQGIFPQYTQSFEVIPMVEVSLTRDEVKGIEEKYPGIEIFPVLDYEVTEIIETIPTQFEIIKTTPKQTSPFTGKGVKVGIIDSGIDTNHEDLEVKGGTCTLETDCPKGIPYHDDLGHGTHVAGIIAAQNNGKGIVGIAPEVELYSIKVINSLDMGTTTQIAKGVEWAIKNNIDILNMSISTKRNDPALKLMLEKAYHSGILLVAAAGNEERGALQDSVQYPAKYPTVIAVGGVNQDKTRLLLSSLGPEVEVAAPGNEIFSTYPGGQYQMMSGTSMASPHIVGISALYKEQYPSLTNYQLRGILTNTAEDIGTPGRDREFGYGLVQYDKLAEQRPIVSHYEENGKVIVDISNVGQVVERQFTIENAAVKELSPGKWEVYKLAGDYKASASFKHDEKVNIYPFDINVDALNYTDMNPNRWFSDQIAYLAYKERVYGYPDNTFRPDQIISRAEAVALLGRAYGLDGKKRTTKFEDVGFNNFASGYIQSAVEEGLLTGFPDGTFRPNDAVTRAEMSLLLQEAYKFSFDSSIPLHFTDMSESVAGYDAIRALTQKGIVQGYPDGKFKPGEPMTRAIYSVFLAGAERPDLFHVKE